MSGHPEGPLEALQQQLAEHLTRRPCPPKWPYEVHGSVGMAYHHALSAWVDRKHRLEHEIGKLTLPQTLFERVAPKTVPRAYPSAPLRLRP